MQNQIDKRLHVSQISRVSAKNLLKNYFVLTKIQEAKIKILKLR